MIEVLEDPTIGGYSVTAVVDRPEHEIRRAINIFLVNRGVDDIVVMYLSCHGLLDARGRLYFATIDTLKSSPSATALDSVWLHEQLEECRARTQVLILDCCFSGAFAGTKSGGDIELDRRLARPGRGRAVLTASRAGEFSYEGKPLHGVPSQSIFTAALIDGLRTGDADSDGDGVVTVDEAYEFAAYEVARCGSKQTPQRSLYGSEGSIMLARNPRGPKIVVAELPESLRLSLESPYPGIRIAAVSTLADMLTSDDPGRARAAIGALQRIVEGDSPAVATAARQALGTAASGGVEPSQALTSSQQHPNTWRQPPVAAFSRGPARHGNRNKLRRPLRDTVVSILFLVVLVAGLIFFVTGIAVGISEFFGVSYGQRASVGSAITLLVTSLVFVAGLAFLLWREIRRRRRIARGRKISQTTVTGSAEEGGSGEMHNGANSEGG